MVSDFWYIGLYISTCILAFLVAMAFQNIAYIKFTEKKTRAIYLSLLGPASLSINLIILIYIIHKNNEHKRNNRNF